MTFMEMLRKRHVRLEHEIAAEQARRMPDTTRVTRLKKLKLAVRDRMAMMTARRPRQGWQQA